MNGEAMHGESAPPSSEGTSWLRPCRAATGGSSAAARPSTGKDGRRKNKEFEFVMMQQVQ